MQKIVNIAFIGILLFMQSSCSLVRRAGKTAEGDENSLGARELIKSVERNNIGDKDFLINRFRIEYEEQGLKRKAGGFIKHSSGGQMLLSIRSVAGIELARASIDRDSLKVYDRINNIMYLQSTNYMLSKYGLKGDFINLLWGDLPRNLAKSHLDISEDHNINTLISNKQKYIVSINDEIKKLEKIQYIDSKYGKISIMYSDYREFNGLTIPCNISLLSQGGELDLNIEYYNLKPGKNRNMKFETGKIDDYIILK